MNRIINVNDLGIGAENYNEITELNDIIKRLIETTTKLTIRLSVFKCDKECQILKMCRDIAECINEIQEYVSKYGRPIK